MLVFRAARLNRRANLTTFCRRSGTSPEALRRAFEALEQRGLVSLDGQNERLTLAGLAFAAALAARLRAGRPPLVACRPLAA